MLTIPNTLMEWSYQHISDLLAAHVYEDARIDWKQDLNGTHKDRFLRMAAAMANGEGGIIVFGIADDRALDPSARIVGVDAHRDFAHECDQLLGNVDPPLPRHHKNPPIVLPHHRAKVLPIVEILPTLAPHAYEGIFYRRRGSGTRKAPTAEVREMFIRGEEVLQRSRLLLLELARAREAALVVAMMQSTRRPDSLRRIDTRLLGELHAATLPLLSRSPQLSDDLSTIRARAEALNYQLDGVLPVLFKPKLDGNYSTPNYDAFVGMYVADRLANAAETLIPALAREFGLDPPRLAARHEIQSLTL